MDKWTIGFIQSGASVKYQSVMHVLRIGGSLENWAKKNTDGMFGAIFGLGQAQEFLQLRPQLAKNLSVSEEESYRRICAASILSQETRIPPLYLLFRDWGYHHLRAYVNAIKARQKRSEWSWIDEDWEEGMDSVRGSKLSRLSDLDESSKLMLYEAAHKGGRMPADAVPRQHRSLFTQPSLDNCVRYTLEDMKSTDLAAFLKLIGQKQSGNKEDRINRILEALPVTDAAQRLKVTQQSYYQLGNTDAERETWSRAIIFLHNISSAIFQLDFQYTLNLHQINQARENGWGIRLMHHAKCPAHSKNVYRYSELDSIDPIAHPDCDAALSPVVR